MTKKPTAKKFSVMIVMNHEVIHYEAISERKFKRKLEEMRALVLKTSGGKNPITSKERVTQGNNITRTRHTFTSGTSYIELHSQVCAEGYHFTE